MDIDLTQSDLNMERETKEYLSNNNFIEKHYFIIFCKFEIKSKSK